MTDAYTQAYVEKHQQRDQVVSMLCTEREKVVLLRILDECKKQLAQHNPEDPRHWVTLLGKLFGDFCRAAFEEIEHPMPSGKAFRSIKQDAVQLAAASISFLLQAGVPKHVQEADADFRT